MSKKNRKGLFDLIKSFIDMVFKRAETPAGKVNISFGLITALVFFMVLAQPIAFFVLKIIQSVLNAFLTYHEKPTLPISESGSTIVVLIICGLILFAEMIFCTLLIHWESQKRDKLKK